MSDLGDPLSLPLPGQKAAGHTPISQCVISFGSNLGDRRELLAAAASQIAQWEIYCPGEGLRTSRLFETPPIGGPGGQEPFLNAIGMFQTDRPAKEILSRLQELEAELGRQRRRRWDARSIDLDVVLHGNLVGGARGLVVPHPRYTARQFVLRPACDVAAQLRDPRFGWTLAELSTHLSAGCPSLALVTGRQEIRDLLCQRLSDEHGIRRLSVEQVEEYRNQGGMDPESGPWVCDSLPVLPQPELSQPELSQPELATASQRQSAAVPRLLVRIHQAESATNWPAPHLMWPNGWNWPEYRLEIEDFDWAVSELASALESMRCAAEPVTADGAWW